MRKTIFIIFAVMVSCRQGPIRPFYSPEFPLPPPLWEEILGEPHWRLEWIDANGNRASWEGSIGAEFRKFLGLDLNEEWASPVLAWPFWPEKGIRPGLMRPAGAIFPWDAREEHIILDWKHGVDAFFWLELAKYKNPEAEKSTPRFPWYFDWPRFRELMASDDVSKEVRLDPWCADWESVAQKTAESGFDRRRIKAAENKKETTVSCLPGLWIGTSPFADPILSSGDTPANFPVGDAPETWFSSSGLLRIQKEAWMYIEW